MSGIAIAGYVLLAGAVLLLLAAAVTSIRRRRTPTRARPDPPAVSAAVAPPALDPLPSELPPPAPPAPSFDAEPRFPPDEARFDLEPAPMGRRRAALLAGMATFAAGVALAWAVARRGKRDARRS